MGNVLRTPKFSQCIAVCSDNIIDSLESDRAMMYDHVG